MARRRLATLQEASGEIRQAIDQAIEQYNGRRGEPASFDQLESLLADQAYRLCYWRVATDEINYRRFFDVDSLAAIRVEDPEVFDAVHQTVLELVRRRWVTGLRIDHADGLLDPAQYLANLAQAVAKALASDCPPAVNGGPGGAEDGSLYTLVEKILAHDEVLPADWPIDGTTGYEFLNLVNDLFVDRAGAYALREVYGRFTRIDEPFGQILYESKRLILTASLSAELTMLSHQLDRISEHHRFSRDFTRLSLYRALREVVAYFPVYRTYIRAETGEVSDSDRWRILTAVRIAKRRNPAMSPSFFDFIASVLLLEDPEGLSDEARAERRRWVLKFQQVTGPVTAKGLEDTAFYRFYPLASLNEVGGDPTIPGATLDQFHRRFTERATNWPHALSTTGTHDTKRGEDVRARLNVLAEIPKQWETSVERWHTFNEGSRVELDGAAVPDANEEYLIYQTLVGTWPLETMDADAHHVYVERIVGYLDKALREAKLHTSWLNPYEEYDQAVAGFIRAILADRKSPFVKDVEKLVRAIADPGFVNSLAQTLIKICAPGVPDFYQGVEFWDFNLVDPDNRRPVDFAARREALQWLKSRAQQGLPELARELLANWPDRRLKMFTIWRALEVRRSEIEVFRGTYEPLAVDGPRAATVFAFARGGPFRHALCIVPRLASESWKVRGGKRALRFGEQGHPWPIGEFWRETVVTLPAEAPTRWRHAITGHVIEAIRQNGAAPLLDLGEVFRWFPVALLVPEET